MAGKHKTGTEMAAVETADHLYELMKRCDNGEPGTLAHLPELPQYAAESFFLRAFPAFVV